MEITPTAPEQFPSEMAGNREMFYRMGTVVERSAKGSVMEPAGQRNQRLGGRYRLLRQINGGGFGPTYLAEDTHRFQELCVLREFNPQVQGKAALDQAQLLFEREASLLYQLDHPQIPRFRELLREENRLFLVQDYVEGPTYRQVLARRQAQGGQLSAAEVTQLLAQVLPVLQYLHGLGMVHRDISPDNLVQRNADGRPVLIDFGSVKQLLVNVRHQMGVPQPYLSPSGTLTRLGHAGYIPETQEKTGIVSPTDDLYALGMTALVLLTGKEPSELYDERKQAWIWPEHIDIPDRLRQTLEQMVAKDLAQRPTSATQVMAMLNVANPYDLSAADGATLPIRMQPLVPPPPDLPPPSTVVAPPPRRFLRPLSPPPTPVYPPPGGVQGTADAHPPNLNNSGPVYPSPVYPDPTYRVPPQRAPILSQKSGQAGGWLALAGIALVLGMAAGLGWWLDPFGWREPEVADTGGNGGTSSNLSEAEQARKQAIRDRATALGVNWAYLVSLTDQFFFEQNPTLQGTQLTDQPQDAPLREEWDALATAHLDRIETHLSPEARGKLGRYNPADQDRWQRQVNERYVSRKALEDLTNARFQSIFPGRAQAGFVETPVDQFRLALAQDRVTAITSGEALTEIRFEPGRFDHQASGNLAPGDGQIYILNLRQGQLMRVNLQAPPDDARLSIYVPIPTPELPYILASAAQTTWAGELPQSGYYEIVVTSQTGEPTNFNLTVGVDNVTDAAPDPPPAKTQ
ncbi:serine/threonine protein kinase [Leptolyngbya sp. BL0902]|uniref:serine/threonine-protein kinase n=1 Tax=Leptolyngbya sp. BL0902 TaxID=1115757 RepID=UPI0018E71FBB|nr:serine/threonine-protein kinase [Leptolyngbya sp. BL0902]QQE65465.1 serine/threonine protein kinase [Leptolyngbya sp. BL0902]